MRAVPAVAAQWLVVAAAQPIHQESLSLQNDFWFNHLRGIAPAHDHVSYVGALSQRAGSFDALPIADFYLLMVYSPWWQHCRRAVVEFNRLAAVLRPADLRPLLMDCTRPVNEKMCSRFLGDPRRPLPLWTAGVDAHPVYVSLSDPWPAAAMPLLVVGSHEEFLSKDNFVRARLAVARLLPGEITAETMLRWVQRARPEALGPLTKSLPTARPPWATFGNTSRTQAEKADLDDLDGWDRFQESDVRAGLALWLHEIFERQVFEIKEEDHRERRRNALLTFLDLLCSYFPDHLPGPSKNPRDCRESLCHLGWLLQDQKFWSSHIENIEVAVQEAPPEGRPGDEPQKPAELKPSTRRFQRLRWEKLEHHWQLCGEPWPELAARGFSRCRSKDPLASGLPCGVWGLMHSVLTEIAELRQCTMAHAENPDDCIGPPKNTTAKELRTFMKEEAQNMKVLEAEQRREFLDEEHAKKPVRLLAPGVGEGWCLKTQGLYAGYTSAPGNNVTAVMRLEVLKGDDKVAGKLISFEGKEVDEMVELQLADDFIRKDGGAIIDRIIKGPKAIDDLEFQFFKLRTVEGSPVPSKAAPWQDMLKGSFLELPELVFEGPRPCLGRPPKICRQKCSRFKFEKVKDLAEGNVTLGKLVDVSDAPDQCIGRLYRRKWFFWSEDLGKGLVPCSEASLYQNVVFGPDNETFCPQDRSHRCLDVDFRLHFEDFPFVAVKENRDMRTKNFSPAGALQIFQRAVQLFWRCHECRVRFEAYKLDEDEVKAPCQASLWLWSVHNAINGRLSDGHSQDSPWPGPGRSPSHWPQRSLCPDCYSKEGKPRPDRLCHFLWNDFYRSWVNVAEKVHSTSHLAARRGGSRGEHFATQWPAARGNFTEKDAVVEGQVGLIPQLQRWQVAVIGSVIVLVAQGFRFRHEGQHRSRSGWHLLSTEES
ncbi:unnamed protein product [Durusdinium trenchii]|uniref:Sulfhydryl oxidase n=1 Tax=Durusdinium trenchii TaxID=1381693 RepID=A0ABP0I688_9DINO